ncbi:MAG: DUF3006 domain-containing protein [Candidatus Veblenbacteria bacterium]|nr:DUF3006 domain-containing protein [Candidatus Veblenbacteria bacterium]
MPVMATIDRFEGEQAVVRLDDGQELVLPRAELPTDAGEGARLTLRFLSATEDEAARAQQARQLLTDLLQRSS